MHYIQGTNRAQLQFISLEDRIAPDNPVCILDAFVDKIDLQQLQLQHTVHNSEGRPPYHPSVLLKLYLYGYFNRIRSSRRLQAECERNLELHGCCSNSRLKAITMEQNYIGVPRRISSLL